jgi:glutaredoxin-like protein NrdH
MAIKVQLYTLSTCGWCQKTKRFLEEHHVEYDSEDVDLLVGEAKEKVKTEVCRHNPRLSYPTMVIDDGREVVVGYDEDRMRQLLGL